MQNIFIPVNIQCKFTIISDFRKGNLGTFSGIQEVSGVDSELKGIELHAPGRCGEYYSY